MTATSSGADLQQLMTIADRYARKLVADTGHLAGVLLIEHTGDLEIVVLEGDDQDVARQARRLLARYQATSAAVLFSTQVTPMGDTGEVFCILGDRKSVV